MHLLTHNLYESGRGVLELKKAVPNCSVDGTLTSESLQASNIVFLEIAFDLKWA